MKSSGSNSYLIFNNASSSAVNFVGFLTNDLTIRNSVPTGSLIFQTARPQNRFTIDSSGNSVFTGNVTVNGALELSVMFRNYTLVLEKLPSDQISAQLFLDLTDSDSV